MSFGRMLPRTFGQFLHPNQLASHTAGPHGGAAAQAHLGGGDASRRYLDQFGERRQDEDWRRLASDETPVRLSGGASKQTGAIREGAVSRRTNHDSFELGVKVQAMHPPHSHAPAIPS